MQRRAALILVVITPALLITSCKSSSKSKLTTPPAKLSATAVAPATTAPAPAPATSTSAAPTGLLPPPPATSPTNLDPCQLVTQGEASTLAGATFGPGREESTGGGKECIYGYQTTNVMDILVAQAVDTKTAQAYYAAGLADAKTTIDSKLPPGTTAKLNTANTEGIGDKAATITGAASVAGQTISFTGIYVLSGATFFTIGDLVRAKPAPTVSAIQDQARTTLGGI